MKKRLTAFLLLAALLCAILSGCGDGSTAQEPAQETPADGGAAPTEITVGLANDLDDSLDPHKTVKAGTREVMFNVFEGLMKPTPDGELTPAIAERYTVSQDQTVYTFTLREGVTFHNGNAVTAADVVYSLQRCAAATETGVVKVEALSAVTGLEATDEHTVTITLAQPDSEFLSYMTTAILPADYDQQDSAPVGTGPFKFVSRAAQDTVVLERYDGYWGTPALLERVTFKIIENADSLVLSLRSGAIDLCNHLPTVQAAQLGEDFTIVEGAMSLVQALYLNNASAPFDNELVRQALCYATDRQQILDLAFDGYGSLVGSSMYPALSKYFDGDLTERYPYDVEKAKALLAEAGYPNGFDMTITVPSNYPQHVGTAQVLAEQYKAVGINVTIQPVEWNTWISDVYVARDYQTTVVGVDASAMTARAMLERFTSRMAESDGNNFVNYKNDEYDALFAQALAAADDGEKTALYKQAEANLADHAANVYIQAPADLVAVRKGLEGVRFYPIYALDLSGLHFTE